MGSAAVSELKKKSDTASANLSKQLQGMDAHLDKADARASGPRARSCATCWASPS